MTVPTDQQLSQDYKKVFTTSDAGVAVLKDLSRFCKEFAMTFDEYNQYKTAFQEGQRRVIRYIREKLNSSDQPRQETTMNEKGINHE